ncbi:hypothetical protein DFH06DRAFT_1298045 [Mycena polygramma]|nr:hypothetical protein DFH06DRAFT_1298045 [Mycena polygramma]
MIATISPAEATLFLPALFLNLDSARIPDASRLDALLSTSSPVPYIHLALGSLRALGGLIGIDALPANASQQLWPHVSLRKKANFGVPEHFQEQFMENGNGARNDTSSGTPKFAFFRSVWNWLDFLHTYGDYLPIRDALAETSTCALHCIVILALDKDRKTSRVIRATPGVRRLLAAAWSALLLDGIQGGAPPSLEIIVEMLSVISDGKEDESNFDEIVEGAGGTIQHLAFTVVQHLSRACCSPDSHSTRIFIRACLAFLRDGPQTTCRLKTALHSSGFIPMLIKVVSRFYRAPEEAMETTLYELLVALRTPPNVAEAIDCGLLPAVVTVAGSITAGNETDDNAQVIYKIVTGLLETVLPLSLVHYCVLAELKKCFHRTMDFAATSTIQTSLFWTLWKDLSALMKARVEFFDSWEEQLRPAFAACDSTMCGKIDARHNLRRCANCQSTNYCSEDCQSADWHAEHRAMCQKLASVKLDIPDTLTTRGKLFLRALVTREHLHKLRIVCADQIVFMWQNPGVDFVTVFHFTQSQNTGVTVVARNGPEIQSWATRPVLELEFSRAMRREGRMEIHAITMFQAGGIRSVPVAMRAETAELRDRVARAAQLIPPETTQAQLRSVVDFRVLRYETRVYKVADCLHESALSLPMTFYSDNMRNVHLCDA